MRRLLPLIPILAIALLIVSIQAVYAQPPQFPWTVYGTVYIQKATSELVPAPEGIQVYAKIGDQVVASTTTDANGNYMLEIPDVSGGEQVDLWVEDTYVTSVTVPEDQAPVEQDLVVPEEAITTTVPTTTPQAPTTTPTTTPTATTTATTTVPTTTPQAPTTTAIVGGELEVPGHEGAVALAVLGAVVAVTAAVAVSIRKHVS